MNLANLQVIPRFSGLDPTVLEWIGGRITLREIKNGDVLFWEGDPANTFYLVFSGAVKVCKHLESGRELILDIFHFGEAVGEIALIDDSDFPATAEVIEDGSVLVMSKTDYLDILDRYPTVSRAVIRDLTYRVRELSSRLKVVGSGSVEMRIACILKTLARHEEGDTMRISRQDLANLAGARLETVVRALKPMVESGIVQTGRNRIEILDYDKLAECAAELR